MAQPTHSGGAPSLIWKIPSRLSCSLISPESKLCYGTNKQSCSNLCNKRKSQFSIHKVCVLHKDSWQPACRVPPTESLLHFSLLTDQCLLYFFTSDLSWLLSKDRSDTTPAVPPPPLKHTQGFSCQRWVNYCCCKVWVGVCTVYMYSLYNGCIKDLKLYKGLSLSFSAMLIVHPTFLSHCRYT